MRVEILKPVVFRGEVKRSGALEVPDATANHWLKSGAARVAVDPPPVSTDPPIAAKVNASGESKKKGF